ncbi:FAD/NAD(P)-binding domain-containing protein [Testicularia cyperi]|uniref:FAD/NAD(P)-binding domain-containing protein n=1 Tax=Testicularia cyperi TaxID=1882483 RepID=A0A317XY18_9BASI|nr:FAD/NAD(P)-binding domain-containing protein [Testicularia cyperi]
MTVNASLGSKRRRVAVIGAGPAGLAMAQQLLDVNQHIEASGKATSFDIVLFERRDRPGGVWTYDAEPGACVIRYDVHGRAYPLWQAADGSTAKDGDLAGRFRPPGPMYDGLRTNLPCDIMTYRSHPYPPSTDLFPARETVEIYTNTFAQTLFARARAKERLDVRFNTGVCAVERVPHRSEPDRDHDGWHDNAWGQGSTWAIESVDRETGSRKTETFDHVVLASGRCNTPTIPRIQGLWNFTGTILHSAWWRSPIPFARRTVLVVGNSSSGSDIARELAGYVLRTLPEGQGATEDWVRDCKTGGLRGPSVLHSYEDVNKPPPLDYDPRDPDSPDWTRRIQVLPKITRIDPAPHAPSSSSSKSKGVIHFEDGTTRDDVDAIIFGTGYAYDFPYLDQTKAPFDRYPLIPPPPSSPSSPDLEVQQDTTLRTHLAGTGAEPYKPPSRLAPFLTNLDDWSLFYRPDPSICVLGAPIRIVPYPITQVQSRVVAAFWAGLLDPSPGGHGLPRLDTTISTTLPERWCSWKEKTRRVGKESSDLGYPADTAYQNNLLSLLPTSLRVAGKDQDLEVAHDGLSRDAGTDTEGDRDGKEHGANEPQLAPVSAHDEGWQLVPRFRNQRRVDTKRLRRRMLGY